MHPSVVSPLGDGFTLGMKMAAGLCPTSPVPETVYPADGLSALRLVPRFGVSTNAGVVVWTRTFDVACGGAWEHYFVSSSPDPSSDGEADYGGWSLDGFSLEWSLDGGSPVSASSSPGSCPLPIPVGPADGPSGGQRLLTLRLRTTRSGVTACPTPLYLLSYTPALGFPDLPSGVSGDTLVSAAAAGDDIAFSVDWSAQPGPVDPPADGSDETFFERFGTSSVSFTRNPGTGLIEGGVLYGVPAGFFEIPFVAPPPAPPLRSILPLPPPARRTALAVLSPRLTFGTGHGPDAAGRLASETRSDGAAVLYSYDAFGRLASSTEGTGRTETFARDALGRVTNETQTVFDELFWTNRTAVLDRPFDAFGRPAGLSLKIDGDFSQSICYDYGVDGHLSGMVLTNAQGRSVSVEYDWEQGRLAGCTVFDSSGAPIFARTVTRAPRRPALVTTVTNAGFEPLTSNLSPLTFSYAYDAVGRPVERGADAFAYNARGEVTNATIDSAAWGYAYDWIGNRETATAPSGTTAYTANALNQYTAVDSWTPSYDADGNLQGDGSLGYAWDAAGRLASARDPNVWRGDPWWSFEYDHRGRRVMKRNWTVLGNWSPPDGHSVYFYDGWNLVHEIRVSGSYQTSHVDYFWGPDLSGTLQGAGGVGGLVAVSINGFFYFPGYDNNGNVVGYGDESGSIVAEYAYDAFGNMISSSGSMASVFPHRFSTKYYDAETDLYYYGYRYYSPALGRWISRDPIEENGGLNLLLFCNNASMVFSDFLGNISMELVSGGPGHFQIVKTARDVDVARKLLFFSEGESPFADEVYVVMRASSVRCIRIRPKINISLTVRPLAEYASGEQFGSSGHVRWKAPSWKVPDHDEEGMPNGYSNGGKNTPYEMVYEHEVGHIEEALDWWMMHWKDEWETWISSYPALFTRRKDAEQRIKDYLDDKQNDSVHREYSNFQANVREHEYWRTMEQSGQVKVLPTQLYDPPGENHKQLFLRVWEKK